VQEENFKIVLKNWKKKDSRVREVCNNGWKENYNLLFSKVYMGVI